MELVHSEKLPERTHQRCLIISGNTCQNLKFKSRRAFSNLRDSSEAFKPARKQRDRVIARTFSSYAPILIQLITFQVYFDTQ